MLLQWITDSQLSVLISDNVAVEVMPATSFAPCQAALPLHEHCLFKLGIHLGELWHLTPLAQVSRLIETGGFVQALHVAPLLMVLLQRARAGR